jgi:hypothetical protein
MLSWYGHFAMRLQEELEPWETGNNPIVLDPEIIKIDDSESKEDGSISNMKAMIMRKVTDSLRHKFLSGTGKIWRVHWTCTK